MILRRALYLGLLAALVAGCTSTGRYSQKYDSAPIYIPGKINPEPVEPGFVEYAPANSRPYFVLGRHYTPMQTGLGYEAKGEASWYGQKFHGHKTANGEIYDMYEFTAAHKTLPLPSFARVTNLENNKQIVVRINDRGPFHNNRLIDLSYASAYKLGMMKAGTAKVKVEVIHVAEDGLVHVGKRALVPKPEMLAKVGVTPEPTVRSEQQKRYIQVAALQDSDKAGELARGLATLYQVPTRTPKQNGIYRLRLGPLADEATSEKLLQELRQSGFEGAYELYAYD